MRKKKSSNAPLIGYWHRPRLAQLLAVGYLVFPLVFWWQMRLAPSGLADDPMSPLVFAQELFCAVTAATALLWVTRPGFFYLLFLSVYFVGFKLYQFSHQTLDAPWEVAGMMFWFAAPAVLLGSQARMAYLEPERRWWNRPERHLHVTGGELTHNGVVFPVVLMNCSEGGAFVRLGEGFAAADPVKDFPQMDDLVRIKIETLPSLDSPFKDNFFTASARVVWTTKVTDPCRNGLGLKFEKLSILDKRRLHRYLSLLPVLTPSV